MTVWFNRVMFTPTAGGTGHFVVSAAVTGYLTPAGAGVPDGSVVDYTAESSDKSQWETGIGTYVSGTTTLQRTTIRESTNGGAAVNFSAAPSVWIDLHAQSVNQVVQDTTPALGGDLDVNGFGLLAFSADSPGSQSVLVPIKTIGVPVFGQGLGVSFEFNPSDSPNLPIIAASITAVTADAASGVEAFDLVLSVMGTGVSATALKLKPVASAVNYVDLFNAASGDSPTFTANGSDTDIGLSFTAKGAPGSPFEFNMGTSDYAFFKLRSTAAGTGGPFFRTVHASPSPADFDEIGGFNFAANNDGAEEILFGSVSCFAQDVSDGTEDSYYVFKVMTAGTLQERLIASTTGVEVSKGGLSGGDDSRSFVVREQNATTNAVTIVERLGIRSSGTPAPGIGVGKEFVVETAADNHEIGGTIEVSANDVTATSEDFDMVFKTMSAGAAAAERLKLHSTGRVTNPLGAVPHFWVYWTANSTTILASYNMTSIADTAVGDADGTIDVDFSSANWAGFVSTNDTTNGWDAEEVQSSGFNARAAGTFGVLCSTITDGGTAVTSLTDPDQWQVMGMGVSA